MLFRSKICFILPHVCKAGMLYCLRAHFFKVYSPCVGPGDPPSTTCSNDLSIIVIDIAQCSLNSQHSLLQPLIYFFRAITYATPSHQLLLHFVTTHLVNYPVSLADGSRQSHTHTHTHTHTQSAGGLQEKILLTDKTKRFLLCVAFTFCLECIWGGLSCHIVICGSHIVICGSLIVIKRQY